MSHGQVGLIVNPIAGIGGPVALKGSDGEGTVSLARSLGAEPVAPRRAIHMLRALHELAPDADLVTYPGPMGEHEARAAGFRPIVLGSIDSDATSAADTVSAAKEMMRREVDLIVFVGGDGTARDLFDSVTSKTPVLGVPAGVKLHSSVFATSPRRAADIVAAYLGGSTRLREQEVMDIDEELARAGRLSARLYGHLSVPDQPRMLQGAKARSKTHGSDTSGIAASIVAAMDDSVHYLLGPGTTVRGITDLLGLGKTLLGVDVVSRRRLVGCDLREAEIYEITSRLPCVIILAVVGGQGYVLGRGNQQISPRVIRSVGSKNVVIVATREKLLALPGPLRVDTGDPVCDRYLTGYRKVVTGLDQESVWMVES